MNTQACEEVYRRRDLPVCLGVRFLSEASTLALSVVVGWTVYKVLQTPLTLGIVGIVEFIPAMLMTLPVGELCDRLSPCPLVVAGLALQGFCALAFFALSTLHMKGLGFFYGVARSAWVSWLALALVGASDMVSVNIRTSLIQLATLDVMRGRVSAANALFISASSELGAIESGAAAAWLGTVAAVALGGIGTIVAAVVWMIVFPAIRQADRVDIGLG
ncbi:hypothetical protein M3A49_30635 [Paraburkholderia sp. CNPSo 3076]|uniref:hypothetical protein n=1 Tax=Paraburkholderia sp. CNPSo 3076 TaxID=2940936 RepID=UPI0022550768|nr:hypothetical protein [Paraburkholderia sp. CNPSo 3076]MCX5543789.1 hypothetical protein [Paraburkholderia sp. CNPSo 3076]